MVGLGDLEQGRLGDAVAGAQGEDAAQAAGERVLVGELLGQRAVERATHGDPGGRLGRVGRHAHEVVRAAVDPAGVGVTHEVLDARGVERQRTGEVPAGEGEDTGLEGVVAGEEQVGTAYALDVLVGHLVEVGDADRGGGDAWWSCTRCRWW